MTAGQVGITLERQAETSFIAGLLLDGLDGVPDDHDVIVGEDDWFFLLFHQGDGRARAYVCTGLSGQHRFAGPEGTARFLEACAVRSFPWSEQVVAATPAGPCATYPGDDTWCAEPYVDGVVLIGDAAGHNDPIIGQGLSIAIRDARTVRDLVLDGARTADAFAGYGAERMARMERLRLVADIMAVTQVEDADNRDARRRYVNERMAAHGRADLPLVARRVRRPGDHRRRAHRPWPARRHPCRVTVLCRVPSLERAQLSSEPVPAAQPDRPAFEPQVAQALVDRLTVVAGDAAPPVDRRTPSSPLR